MFVGNVCDKTEEAINFYVSVFKSPPVARGPGRRKRTYPHFSLLGQEFGAMGSAREHRFAFNEAISFIVPCDTQEEIDYFWEKLSADPKAEQCGWLKDKYSLSWQITPAIMPELLRGDDKKRIGRVTQAFSK
jgi:predicted 3-demethylubiquinone-9 3-methyltransferase (glyoxalase superfamily)